MTTATHPITVLIAARAAVEAVVKARDAALTNPGAQMAYSLMKFDEQKR